MIVPDFELLLKICIEMIRSNSLRILGLTGHLMSLKHVCIIFAFLKYFFAICTGFKQKFHCTDYAEAHKTLSQSPFLMDVKRLKLYCFSAIFIEINI